MEELKKYRIGIAAIREIRWPETETMDRGDFKFCIVEL